MKIAFLFLVLMIARPAFAQNCADLNDGETIRIDEGDKSLAQLKIQDQDGLGSCYANAASLLLQGALPNNPEISYIHLATIYKTESLKIKRSSASDSKNYDIYVQESKLKDKAINGDGLAMKWDLALDGGNTCGVVAAVREQQEKNKKPVMCARTELNLEKILSSGDVEHKQFKTVLESSLYMNQFQKIFGDINEEPGFFNKKRVLAAQEKYQGFKNSFETIIANKRKKIKEQDCGRINTDYLSPVVAPLTQTALGYKACFKEDFPSKDEYWCQVVKALSYLPKPQADGSIDVSEADPAWMKRLQARIAQRKTGFNPDVLQEDIMESLVQGLNLSEREKNTARYFMKGSIFTNSSIKKNLEKLSQEYNEVTNSGFSPLCVERNTYNYFYGKDFERDWQQDANLCSHEQLMRQAANVIIKYKESGLNDLGTVFDFLTSKAGQDYDQAMMAMYASDCDEKSKIALPKDVSCTTISTSRANKSDVDSIIVKKLKNNQPLTASLCSQILKKTKAQFAAGECGNHALGITGVQCKAGKYRYLIQNSWGANSKAINNPGIETIEGKGAYWFDEQSFYDSVYGVDHLN